MHISKLSHRISIQLSKQYQNGLVEWSADGTLAASDDVKEAVNTLRTTVRDEIKSDAASVLRFALKQAQLVEDELAAQARAESAATIARFNAENNV